MAMKNIESEVTGTVWKILVEVGQTVENEEAIMILESMKMEIPVESPGSGTVTELLVAFSDHVEEGQVVAIVDLD